MTRIFIAKGQLIVEPEGLDTLWAFAWRLQIPLAHVRSATVEPYQPQRIVFGLRFPGTHIPGLIKAGTYYENGERTFWLVRRAANVVAIELSDEPYARLVLEIADPNALVHTIYRALRGAMV